MTLPRPGGPARAADRSSPTVRFLSRLAVATLVLLAVWWAVVLVAQPEPFLLPDPPRVFRAFLAKGGILFDATLVTLAEMVIGLAAGVATGIALALLMALVPATGQVVMPYVVVLQSMPVFAIAPILVLWFGFGLVSKVIMAALIVFFPVASALHDGLTRTDPGLIDLAGLYRCGRWKTLLHFRLPAALPGLATGLRMAAALAPVSAIIGEWVGASQGLGPVMLHANARMQTDTTFAALIVVAWLAVALKLLVDDLTRRMVPWAEEIARD